MSDTRTAPKFTRTASHQLLSDGAARSRVAPPETAPTVSVDKPTAFTPPPRRTQGDAVLRIIFGLLWVVVAAFKLLAAFITKFSDYLTTMSVGAARSRVTAPETAATVSVAEPETAATVSLAKPETITLSPRRTQAIGVLRIIFGLVWAVDAAFKWSPAFINKFSDYLAGAKDGQPQLVKDWIDFWVKIVKVDPHVFAHLVAVGETAVAIGLILGAFSNLTYVVGGVLALVIWTTAEAFGGPYHVGSTDIGAAVIYVIVFAGLFLATAGRYLGLDTRLARHLPGRWADLASGRIEA